MSRCLRDAKRRYDEVHSRKQAMNKEQSEKYSRQILFPGIGEDGQEKILAGSAVLAGCGALGTVTANLLVRAGLGRLRIIDRDFVELSNLQRQTLFEEADARDLLPKAIAAERRLHSINSDVRIEGMVGDLVSESAEELLSGFDVIIDGTDNFETRLLLNDAALSFNIPWIYGAAIGSYGVTFTIQPGHTACLACLLEGQEKSSDAAAEATCDTAGILNAAAGVVGSIEAAEAIKILAGKPEALHGKLLSCDVWSGKFQSVRVSRNPDCRACGRREFSYLEGDAQPHITMCGRDSVQIHERGRRLDLGALGQRLKSGSVSEVRNNKFLLRFQVAPYEMTVFADGRAIVKGTKDPAVARSLYARFVGA
jgi:molybdopterin/thiamine biosynthesis adenylyltransferase